MSARIDAVSIPVRPEDLCEGTLHFRFLTQANERQRCRTTCPHLLATTLELQEYIATLPLTLCLIYTKVTYSPTARPGVCFYGESAGEQGWEGQNGPFKDTTFFRKPLELEEACPTHITYLQRSLQKKKKKKVLR